LPACKLADTDEQRADEMRKRPPHSSRHRVQVSREQRALF